MFYMWQIHIGKDQRHGIPGFLRESGEGKEVRRNNEGGQRKKVCASFKKTPNNKKKQPPTPKTTYNLHLIIFKN